MHLAELLRSYAFCGVVCHFDYVLFVLICGFFVSLNIRSVESALAIDHFSEFCSGHEKKKLQSGINDKKSRKSHTNLRSRTDTRENVRPQPKKKKTTNFVNDSIASGATEFRLVTNHFTFSMCLLFSAFSPN